MLTILAIFAESVPSSLLISVDFFVRHYAQGGGADAPNAPAHLEYAPGFATFDLTPRTH